MGGHNETETSIMIETEREILRQWNIKLRQSVKPMDILQSIDGLTQSDIESVQCASRNDGNLRGMDVLLDVIKRRDSCVFYNFLVALEQHGHRDLATAIIEENGLQGFGKLRRSREQYGQPARVQVPARPTGDDVKQTRQNPQPHVVPSQTESNINSTPTNKRTTSMDQIPCTETRGNVMENDRHQNTIGAEDNPKRRY